MTENRKNGVLVIGGGPAGLTAAHRLTRRGFAPIVLEQRDKVGGIACTEQFKGFLFDMGGHRFFSQDPRVHEIWNEMLGEDFEIRRRVSRIYFNGRFFDYPLRPGNVLRGIGPANAAWAIASYLRWRLLPHRKVETFEHWVTNRFGRRLFQMFFRSYTEKVWGIPCSELSASWAAQRIKNLSLARAAINMIASGRKNKVRTLIEEFHYPKKGPGMMWETMGRGIEQEGGKIALESKAISLLRDGNRISGVTVARNGDTLTLAADYVISSMPISSALKIMEPAPPAEVVAAASNLKYRDFLTVCLIVRRHHVSPDQWIYVHDPGVRVGRIQNYKNWSPAMSPDPELTGLGLEYFCQEGDDLWTMTDEALVELASEELHRIGLVNGADVVDGTVFRVPKAYPIYDGDYEERVSEIRRFVESLEGFQTVGRNGLFRYNNMDHSMLSALHAAERVVRGDRRSVWDPDLKRGYIEDAPDA